MKPIFRTLVLAGLLVLGGALAQEGSDSDQKSDGSSDTEMTSMMSPGRTFGDFDTNADTQIDENEFYTTFGTLGLFELFDAAQSGLLDSVRFRSGLFDMLDTNMDGLLSESELAGLSAWGIDQSFADLDTDQSGDVSREEFERVDVDAILAQFDADQSGDLTEDEFTFGIFIILDADRSGTLSREELDANPGFFQRTSLDEMDGMDDASNDQGIRDDSDQDGTGK